MIIPNSFQAPNVYIDRIMPYLTESELRVLLYATRHILGWQDRIGRRRGKISLKWFVNGFKTQDGTVYAGCGLSKQVVINALNSLVEYGILLRVGEPDKDGQEWGISDTIHWDKLESVQAERTTKRRQQMSKARETLAQKQSGGLSNSTSTVEQTAGGTVEQTAGGLSNSTQSKLSSKPSSKPVPQRKVKTTKQEKQSLIDAWYTAMGYEAFDIGTERYIDARMKAAARMLAWPKPVTCAEVSDYCEGRRDKTPDYDFCWLEKDLANARLFMQVHTTTTPKTNKRAALLAALAIPEPDDLPLLRREL